jgi:hypothetical protein
MKPISPLHLALPLRKRGVYRCSLWHGIKVLWQLCFYKKNNFISEAPSSSTGRCTDHLNHFSMAVAILKVTVVQLVKIFLVFIKPPLDPILSDINPAHTLTHCLVKIHFTVIHLCMAGSPKGSLLVFEGKFCIHFLSLSCVLRASYTPFFHI